MRKAPPPYEEGGTSPLAMSTTMNVAPRSGLHVYLPRVEKGSLGGGARVWKVLGFGSATYIPSRTLSGRLPVTSPHASVPTILRREKRYGHSTMTTCRADMPKECRYAGSALVTRAISVRAADVGLLQTFAQLWKTREPVVKF